MPQNHAQKEDDFLKMADDSILLRRRTLYPGEVQGRVGTVHYSAKAAARQGNYRAALGAARCV